MENNKKLKSLLTVVFILFFIIAIASFINLITHNFFIIVISLIISFASMIYLEIMKIKQNNKSYKRLIPTLILIFIFSFFVTVYFASPTVGLITTGQYGQGTVEDNELVDSILGKEYAKERYELYFQWYNVLHEIGHAVMAMNNKNRIHVVDEEQLVNDFAVAYWSHYGEAGKLDELQNIVAYSLGNFNRPAPAHQTHMDYAREMWGKKELFTFNNYGWFQFSLVDHSLNNRKSLEAVLTEMGVKNIKPQPQKILVYASGEESVHQIILDAFEELRKWGVELPPFYHTFSTDPNAHMLQLVKNIFGALDRYSIN